MHSTWHLKNINCVILKSRNWKTKVDLERLKNELLTAQNKYTQRLSEYEIKLQEVYNQSEKIRQEQDEKETNLLNATSEWVDIKTKLETSVISPKEKVILNVGGEYFETTIATLTKDNQKTISYFQSLFSKQWHLQQ
jgi:F0F1-type ATP synthase membrane subunit b/b'